MILKRNVQIWSTRCTSIQKVHDIPKTIPFLEYQTISHHEMVKGCTRLNYIQVSCRGDYCGSAIVIFKNEWV